MKAKRRVYWLSFESNAAHQDKVAALTAEGFFVRSFQSIDALFRFAKSNRAGIIIVSDGGNANEVIESIKMLSESPETQGVRFVLSTSGNSSHEIRDIAAACAFREILPLELDRTTWISRLNYATARQNISVGQPVPQVTMNNIAGVAVPARVSWITHDHVQLEAKIAARPGDQINLAGAFAGAMGLRVISATVVEHSRTNLRFRLGESILASWKIPATHRAKLDNLIDEIKLTSPGERWRVFVAVQDPELRSEALSKLTDPRFDVRVPLQKQHIIDEPKFLGPDAVIIEDNLCIGDNRETFLKMMEHVNRNVPVFIIGKGLSQGAAAMRKDSSGIIVVPKLPKDFSEVLVSDYLKGANGSRERRNNDAIHIPSDHRLSFAEIKLPARMTRLHPTAIQISVGAQIGKFGLVKFESPSLKKILGYHPYGKITESSELHGDHQDQFSFVCEALLSDVDIRGRKLIGYSLAKAVAERLIGGAAAKKLISQDIPAEAPVPVEAETSAKSQPASKPPLSLAIPISLPKQAIVTQGSVGNLALKPVSIQPVSLQPERFETEESEEIIAKVRMHDAISDSSRALWDQFAEVFTSKTLRYLIVFIAVTAGGLAVMMSLVKYISAYYERSGKQYTESLERMLEQNGVPTKKD